MPCEGKQALYWRIMMPWWVSACLWNGVFLWVHLLTPKGHSRDTQGTLTGTLKRKGTPCLHVTRLARFYPRLVDLLTITKVLPPSKGTISKKATPKCKKLKIICFAGFCGVTWKLFSRSSPLKHWKSLFLLKFFQKSACNSISDIHCLNHRKARRPTNTNKNQSITTHTHYYENTQ